MVKLATTTAYTVEEAAEILHKAKSTIYGYIRSGELRAQKVGHTWYITDKTLTEFVTGEYTGSDKI